MMVEEIVTPVGNLTAVSSTRGICYLGFDSDKTQIENHKGEDKTEDQVATRYLSILKIQLTEYFAGLRKEFTVPLDIQGTDFYRKAWSELLKIPYGTTRTYSQQAQSLNNPRGVRAVARANSKNRIAILIPCHRIIGSDNKLTGYAGGIERKRWLLIHEKKHSGNNEHTIFNQKL